MKTILVVASGLFLIMLLAACANVPIDVACRAGLDSEFSLLGADDRPAHRSPNFDSLLFEAQDNELAGDYQSCLNNLKMAHVHSHQRTPKINLWGEQFPIYSERPNDAAHHAAGHTHHHGHN